MNLFTSLNIGDKIWTMHGESAIQVTIGQIRVEYTHAQGCADWEYRGGVIVNGGENYAPIPPTQTERYMCTETGIGSGTLYTLGDNVHLTKEDCIAANKEYLESCEQVRQERRRYEDEDLLRREAALRRDLERIEALKLERGAVNE